MPTVPLSGKQNTPKSQKKLEIHIPSRFYYEKEEEGSKYSTQPVAGSIPSLSRLTQGKKDFWVTREPVKVQAKKNLILSDWTLFDSCAFENKRAILRKLLTAEEPGFVIWMCQDYDLIPLTLPMLESEDFEGYTEKIAFDSKEIPESIIKKYKLHTKPYEFLDDSVFTELETGEPYSYCVKISDLVSEFKTRSREDLKFFLDYISIAKEKITFISDEISDNAIEFLRDYEILLTMYGDIKHDYRIIGLSKSINIFIHGIKFITILSKTISVYDVRDLPYCNNTYLDWTYLSVVYEVLLPSMTFPRLRTITTKRESLFKLEKFINISPNLEELILCFPDRLESSFGLREFSLKKIKLINVSGSKLSPEHIENLRKAAPNAKIIGLREERQKAIPPALSSPVPRPDDLPISAMLPNTFSPAPRPVSPEVTVTKPIAFSEASSSHQFTSDSQETKLPAPPLQKSSESSSLIPAQKPPVQDPIFNLNNLNNIRPPDEEFIYAREKNEFLNQTMIINQLSQYLRIKGNEEALIKKIQKGICEALAKLSLDHMGKWQENFKAIQSWDGDENSLTDKQESILKDILAAVRVIYDNPSYKSERTLLGDYLEEYFLQFRGSCTLHNFNHVIGVVFDKHTGLWNVYDPEYFHDYKVVTREELIITIKNSLGAIVAIEGKYEIPEEKIIRNKEKFLAQGGFLFLCQSRYNSILKWFTKSPISFRKENSSCLRGLFLRNGVQGAKPAWILGLLNSHSKAFFESCIQSFFHYNQDTYRKEFLQSLSALPQHAQDACMRLLDYLIKSYREKKTEETKTFFLLKTHYKKLLSEIHTDQQLAPTKVLYRTTNKTHTECILSHYQEAKENHRAVFLVESPEDLENATEWLREGKDKAPLLLIDFRHFSPAETVRFCELMKEGGLWDSIRISKEIHIKAFQNTENENTYDGIDFTSLFQKEETVEDESKLPYSTIPITVTQGYPGEDYYIINLFEGYDWRERLRGTLRLQGKKLVPEEDELIKALCSGKPIAIVNGPQQNECYHFFLQRLLGVDKEVNGLSALKEKIALFTGYPWRDLKNTISFSNLTVADFYAKEGYILNSASLPMLFSDLRYDEKEHRLYQGNGWLDFHARKQGMAKPFPLLLTNELNKHQWAELLIKAKKLGLILDCKVLPGISLPEELETNYINTVDNSPLENQRFSSFITSKDVDAAAAILKSQNPSATVIHISELQESDLIRSINLMKNTRPLDLLFEVEDGFMLKELKENPKASFILKGNFHLALLSALLPLLKQYPGRITLVTKDKELFLPFLPREEEITFKKLLSCLTPRERAALSVFSVNEFGDLSLVEIKALAAYQRIHPENRDVKKPWEGYYRIDKVNPKDFHFDPATSEAEAKAFHQGRLSAVEDALKYYPFVFIGGLTGVGKSTFMEYFELYHPGCVYYGENNIKTWAEKGGYLFIDEANITREQWSQFEGLFEEKPYIIIEGEKYNLTPEHKVIFAGNPLNYGGSRHQPSLFKRHGNSLIFSPLPSCVVYEDILKPLFGNTILESNQEVLSKILLKAYGFLMERSETFLLVTPRQLKSVVMLTLAECSQFPNKDAREVLSKNMHRILDPLVPEEAKEQFNQEFPYLPKVKDKVENCHGYVITPSRQEPVKTLKSFLDVRDSRRNIVTLNETQTSGDLSSVILEGDIGVGKISLLVALMEEYGIQKGDIHSERNYKNAYYLIPPNLSFDKKEKILLKAFHEGNVVIMKNMNSSPMMERLVNALLSGKTPQGEKPKRAGFIILGTQHPVTTDGVRHEQTQAQEKRSHVIFMKPSSENERDNILQEIGLSVLESKALREVVNEENSPRDLWTLAEMVLNHKRDKTHNALACRLLVKNRQPRVMEHPYPSVTKDFAPVP